MKKSNKHGFRIVALCVAFSLLGGGIVYAAENWANIWVQLNSVNLTVNGSPVTTTNLLYNDTTYVPLRACAEMLGSQVGWDQNTNTASIIPPASSSDNSRQVISDMKTAAYLAFYWQAIGDLGRTLQYCSLDLYTLCRNKASNSSNQIYIDALNKAITDFNNLLEKYDSLVADAAKLGIDSSGYNSVFVSYSAAIDALKAGYDALKRYYQTGQAHDCEECLDQVVEAYDQASNGWVASYQQFSNVITYQAKYGN